ncbi:hypothetical protein ABIB38_003912 [Massilia sp. UYP11]
MPTASTTGRASQPAASQYADLRTNLTQSLPAGNPGLPSTPRPARSDEKKSRCMQRDFFVPGRRTAPGIAYAPSRLAFLRSCSFR